MTREEIVKEYDVNKYGIIQSPGKFEGEMLYVPYFWDMVMNGMHDHEREDGTCVIDVEEDDRKMFPDLENIDYVTLYEDGNGFVYTRLYK